MQRRRATILADDMAGFSRLDRPAEPGGVGVSRTACDHLEADMPMGCEEAAAASEGIPAQDTIRAEGARLPAARRLVAISRLDGWRAARSPAALDRWLAMAPRTSIEGARRGLFTESDAALVATCLDALRAAGIPEPPPPDETRAREQNRI